MKMGASNWLYAISKEKEDAIRFAQQLATLLQLRATTLKHALVSTSMLHEFCRSSKRCPSGNKRG